MRSSDDYLSLIAPEHADKPKFVATVGIMADVLARFQAFLAAMPQEFDLDYAIGVQLDAVGVRIGRARTLNLPLPPPWFSWGVANLGWGRGIWKGPLDPGSYLASLDDDTYRRLLKSKVLANRWDGTPGMLEAIYSAYFIDPDTEIFVQDNAIASLQEQWFTWGDPMRGWGEGYWRPAGQPIPSVATVDMSITVGVSGKVPGIVDLGLLQQGLVGAKPEGVRVTYAVTSVDQSPVFGWGVNNEFIGGWGYGAWPVSPTYAIANPPLPAVSS